MRLPYIGVVGVNGYGVYIDAWMIEKSKPFIKEYQARFFEKPETAVKWCRNKYNKLQGKDKDLYQIEPIQKVNWFYHRRKK